MSRVFHAARRYAGELPSDFLRFSGRVGRAEYWAKSSIILGLGLLVILTLSFGTASLVDLPHEPDLLKALTLGLFAIIAFINLLTLPMLLRRVRDLELPAWVYILLSTTFFTSQVSAELYPFRSWVFVPLLLAAGFGPTGFGRVLHFRKPLGSK